MDTELEFPWYEATVIIETDGEREKASFLIADVMTFTEAECLVFDEVRDAKDVVALKRVNIYEIVGSDTLAPDADFYLVVAKALVTDDKGREKEMKYNMVTQGFSTPNVVQSMEEYLRQGYDMALGNVVQKPWRAILRPGGDDVE